MGAVKRRKKWSSPVWAFITVNILFVLVHVYQYVVFVKTMRSKQQIEKHLVALQEKKQQRSQEFEAMKSRCMVRHYAAKELGMKAVSLKQVKKLDMSDEHFDS